MDLMDLKHIDSWDREKLEAEARDIGVWAPHRSSFGESERTTPRPFAEPGVF